MQFVQLNMNSTKLVILLHSLHWSNHTKDESKRGTAFAFIFGELTQALWCHSIIWSLFSWNSCELQASYMADAVFLMNMHE